MTYPHLFSPIELAGHTLKNRWVMGPTAQGFEAGRYHEPHVIHYYRSRALEDQLGLVIVGGNAIDLSGRRRLLDKSPTLFGWRRAKGLTDALHELDTKVLAQLTHNGNDALHPLNFAASTIVHPETKRTGWRTPGMVADYLIRKFVAHADRAIHQGGFDGVELYAGHRSLLNCFTSPALNQRGDKWGLKTGFRFPKRLVRALRRKLGPEPLLTYRVSLLDLVPNGTTWAQLVSLVNGLSEVGVDAFSFEIGLGRNQVPAHTELTPPGVWFDFMSTLSEETGVPIFFGFGLPKAERLNEYLETHPTALVEVDREIVADAQWVNKYRMDDLEHARPDIDSPHKQLAKWTRLDWKCQEAQKRVERHGPNSPRPVLVVGGGPAGMSAALTCARLGREVTLVDDRAALGGLYRLATGVPGRDSIERLLQLREAELVEAGVTIIKNQHVSYDWIVKHAPESEIIVAAGTDMRIPDIPGIDSPNVYTFEDLFESTWTRRRHIAILGENSMALDIARYFCPKKTHARQEWLKAWGIGDPRAHRGGVLGVVPELFTSDRSVYLITGESLETLESALLKSGRYFDLSWLRMNGMRTFENADVSNIDNNHIRLLQRSSDDGDYKVFHQTPYVIPEGFEVADELVVVVTEGLEPRNDLVEELRDAGRAFMVAGAMNIEKHIWGASQASLDGTEVGLTISE